VPEEAYPTGIVLTLVFRLLFEDEEVGSPHAGEVTVESESGERLTTITFTVTPQRSEEELPPGWKHSVPLVAPVPVQFPNPGLYAVSIAVGGTPLKTIPLRMKVAGE
jgi:hypothetical protein